MGTLLVLISCLAGWAADIPPKLSLLSPTKAGVAGSRLQLTVTITFADGLHGYQNPPSEDWMIPVKVSLSGLGVKVNRITYPKGESLVVGGLDTPAMVYGGKTDIQVEFTLPNTVGPRRIPVRVEYQQCDDQNCYAPNSLTGELAVEVTAPAGATPGQSARSETPTPAVAGRAVEPPKAAETKNTVPPPDAPVSMVPNPEDPVRGATAPDVPAVAKTTEQSLSAVETVAASTVDPSTQSGLSGLLQESFRSQNYLLLFALLFVVGLAINLTPCVYPMIPITIGFFSNQAGSNRAARFGLGAMYMAGIAVTYGVVGGVAAGAGATFGALFTQTWFLYGLAFLMFGLALSMFDVYQIGLPAGISRQLKGRSGAVGALIMGLMVGVAAAPCAGPVIVAIFSEVAKLRNVPMGILIFSTVGLGLGLPYLLLGAASSGAAKSLPKAGGWMKAVKSILGFIVIGVGLSYLLQALPRSISEPYTLHIWAGFYALAAFYFIFLDRSGTTQAIFAIKATSVLLAGILIGMGWQRIQTPSQGPEIAWQPLTEASWTAAKASGKPIFIDATANWCAECRVIEANVLEKPETVAALKNSIAMRIDWSTGVDPLYQKWTADTFNIKGLPHLIVTRPGGSTSQVFNHLETPDELIRALRVASN